jgi:Protein of unknown function (DUF1524)
VRAFALTTAQADAAIGNGSKLYARIGDSTRMRCSRLLALPPTGAYSGMTMRVPASPSGAAGHLFTVTAFEPWAQDPSALLQPSAGNALVTALVRINTQATMLVGPALFHARDAAGNLYEAMERRQPSLGTGVLSAGEVASGWLTFEVPVGDGTGLSLIYTPAPGVAVTVRLTPLVPPVPDSTPTPPTGASTLATVLAGLRVAPEQRAGYSRDLFVHWIDADGNGCDTRREVLIQEAIVAPTVGAGCDLTGGQWLSQYDGLTFSDPSLLDIDHVVPLAEAWDSGAYGWDAGRRQTYANDLGVTWSLIAVSAGSNRSKSDADPAEWLPPNISYRCQYVGDWVAVKARWGLAVDPVEKAAIAGETACQDTPVQVVPVLPQVPGPTSTPTPNPTPTPSPTPSSTPGGGSCDPNYAGYCVPIVPYDLDCGDIRHRVIVVGVDIHRFDGDHDGVGCESYP